MRVAQARTMINEPSSQAIEPSPHSAERPFPVYRRVTATSVIWFFGFPALLIALPPPADDSPVWILWTGIACGLGWVASGYWIYHTLFNMAEARWPSAKGIREIVSPLLKGLLFPHHHK
jgi:hypothetical protein